MTNLAINSIIDTTTEYYYISKDFSNSNLNNYKFYEVAFTNCDFTNAQMRDAEFIKCTFKDCNLSDADFTNSDLTDAEFISCLMTNAILTNIDSNCASFLDCNVHDITKYSDKYAMFNDVYFVRVCEDSSYFLAACTQEELDEDKIVYEENKYSTMTDDELNAYYQDCNQ